MTDTTTARPDLARALLDGPRPALQLDAVVTGVNGAAYLAAAGPIGDLLGLSPALLRGAGGFLLAFTVCVVLASRRPTRGAVSAVVAANVAWAALSVVMAVAGWGSPTVAGTVWIVLQGVVVGAFAELQLTALRRVRSRT